ncbi:SDR family NAD(P)-dependent oxidoreductase [Colwellia sp. MEBiC06753]
MNVLITGATSGIGKALVKQYILAGAKVIACGRNQQKLDDLIAELTLAEILPENNQSQVLQCLCFDITDKLAIAQQLKQIEAIELAILNAGDCEYIDDVMHFDAERFEWVIQVNLIAMAYLTKALLPKLKPQGRLAFMSSSVTYLPFPRAQAYGASKAGVDYLASALRLDLLPHQLNVSVIHPGFVDTALTQKNDFNMPFLITSEQAATRVYQGLNAGKDIIEFPRRFIWLLKLFAILPAGLWQRINKPNLQKHYLDKNISDR